MRGSSRNGCRSGSASNSSSTIGAGAGGNIASDFVVHAAADGYTLLYASTAVAINATLYEGKVNYDFLRDIVPVAGVVRTPVVMEVNLDLPVKTVPEFIAYAKANPGKINMATVGPGSAQHLYGEYFKMMTGIDMVPVHYHGAAPAITDLIAGRVQVMFDVVVSSMSYIKSGQIRALAVTTATPQDVLPGVPTVGEFVPGYEASGWQGLCAPAKTPPDIVERLNREINAGLADPSSKQSSPSSAASPSPARRPISANSSPPKPTNGARSCARPASRPSERKRLRSRGTLGARVMSNSDVS